MKSRRKATHSHYISKAVLQTAVLKYAKNAKYYVSIVCLWRERPEPDQDWQEFSNYRPGISQSRVYGIPPQAKIMQRGILHNEYSSNITIVTARISLWCLNAPSDLPRVHTSRNIPHTSRPWQHVTMTKRRIVFVVTASRISSGWDTLCGKRCENERKKTFRPQVKSMVFKIGSV